VTILTIRISVQICSYNRWHLLKKSLEALFAQDLAKDQYEIVLVDDGSTDDSLSMAKELAKTAPCRLKVLTKPNDGLSRARNLGIRNCDGEIILFMDDDTFADPGLLREHLSVHALHPRCVVIGWVNHIEQLDPPEPRKYVMADYSRSFFWTSNVSVRKQFVEQVGLFDEDFLEYGWEDLELGWRLKKLGLERQANPKAIVSHFKPPKHKKDLPGMFRQAASSGRSALVYIRKRPTLNAHMATGITWPRMALDQLLRPFEPIFQRGLDQAPEGPLTGWAFWCARILCSFRFFDAVRKGDTRRPERTTG
jgi:glycosyltransferase involved in cell wall biosynthesis